LIRLSRQGVLPVGDFSKLPLIETQSNNSKFLQISADNFYQALRNQSLLSCNNIILSAYKNKMPIEKITDEIIQPSMARIGEEWVNGTLPIFYEHCATQICISTLFKLRNFINSRDNTNGPIAIGGCITNDHYQLSNMLVDILLFDLGWNTVNIGSNTPIQSFIDGINHFKPRLVWMSTTSISNVDEFVKDNLLLFEKVCNAGTVLVVGGQGLTPAIRKKIKFHFYGDTMCHLADYARGLFPPAVLPQRGRPPLPV
jgi:methanogenic corrinoid protein MtbC1